MGACQAGTKILHRQHNSGGRNQTGSTQSSQTGPAHPRPVTFTRLEAFSTEFNNSHHFGFGDFTCFVSENFSSISKGKCQLRRLPSPNTVPCVLAW